MWKKAVNNCEQMWRRGEQPTPFSPPLAHTPMNVLSTLAQSCLSADSQPCAVNQLDKAGEHSEGRELCSARDEGAPGARTEGHADDIVPEVWGRASAVDVHLCHYCCSRINVVGSVIRYELTGANFALTGLISDTKSNLKLYLSTFLSCTLQQLLSYWTRICMYVCTHVQVLGPRYACTAKIKCRTAANAPLCSRQQLLVSTFHSMK